MLVLVAEKVDGQLTEGIVLSGFGTSIALCSVEQKSG